MTKIYFIYTLSFFFLIFSFFFSLFLGNYSVSFLDLFSANFDPNSFFILFELRLPRILFALASGIGISLSGLILQSIFHNPLVSPSILSISSAASFGSILAIFLNLDFFFRLLFGSFFSIVSISILLLITQKLAWRKDIYLILMGILLSSFFSSLISFIKYFADPELQLPQIIFWLMGSFSMVEKQHLFLLILILLPSLFFYKIRFQLNQLLFQSDEKIASIPRSQFKLILFILISLMNTSIISMTGNIPWVALTIPNIIRILVGSSHENLLPLTALFGASYMLFLDTLARSLTLYEMPIGIFSAFLSTLFFIFILLFNPSFLFLSKRS